MVKYNELIIGYSMDKKKNHKNPHKTAFLLILHSAEKILKWPCWPGSGLNQCVQNMWGYISLMHVKRKFHGIKYRCLGLIKVLKELIIGNFCLICTHYTLIRILNQIIEQDGTEFNPSLSNDYINILKFQSIVPL